MKVLLTLLLFATCTSAQSLKDGRSLTEWTRLGYSDDIKAEVFYATRSVKRNENQIKLWARWDFPEGAEKRFAPEWRGPVIGSFRAYLVFQCEKKAVKGLAAIAYSVNGDVMAEERGSIDIGEKPGTIGSAIFNYFCEREPLPPRAAPSLKPKP